MRGLTKIPFFISGFCFLLNLTCSADSWFQPTPFETHSENKKIIARVTPRTTNSSPQLVVSAIERRRTNQLWKAKLVNSVSPTTVAVSDDGASVVTFDNWGRSGYGDDVVAFYTRAGLAAKYSLEDFAPPRDRPENSNPFMNGYRAMFTHSTSSRHWQQNSLQFFALDAGVLFFSFWLDWDSRWIVWRTSDGSLSRPDTGFLKRLESEGRSRALKLNQSGFSPEALTFLAHLRIPEDKPLIEFWLSDTNFHTGLMSRTGTGIPGTLYTFFAYSMKRLAADQALARWGGKDSLMRSVSETYDFLGTLEGTVQFTVHPAKNEGSIRIYVIPQSKPLNEWATLPASQYLVADLKENYPHDYSQPGKSRDATLTTSVNFAIWGVTPGNYRLKAVWDKSFPYAPRNKIVYRPQPGDYESVNSPTIVCRAGLTNKVHLDCTTLVQ